MSQHAIREEHRRLQDPRGTNRLRDRRRHSRAAEPSILGQSGFAQTTIPEYVSPRNLWGGKERSGNRSEARMRVREPLLPVDSKSKSDSIIFIDNSERSVRLYTGISP